MTNKQPNSGDQAAPTERHTKNHHSDLPFSLGVESRHQVLTTAEFLLDNAVGTENGAIVHAEKAEQLRSAEQAYMQTTPGQQPAAPESQINTSGNFVPIFGMQAQADQPPASPETMAIGQAAVTPTADPNMDVDALHRKIMEIHATDTVAADRQAIAAQETQDYLGAQRAATRAADLDLNQIGWTPDNSDNLLGPANGELHHVSK